MTGIFREVPYGNRLHKTLELGQAIADKWGKTALFLRMAREIKTRAGATTKKDEARAVREWVQTHVRYFADPHGAEVVGEPFFVMQNGGDCDDLATLAAALLIALGHNARLAAVRWEGRTQYTHAVVADLTAQAVVDPVSVAPEIWPPKPYKVGSFLYIKPSGEFAELSGLFGKFVKAIAKPFTKVFKPKTLLGKIADPLGLMSRNLKHTMKVADVVGTAAAVVTGAYVVGAAAGATGGFWATAGAGAKAVGAGLLKAGTAVKGGAVTAAKAILPAVAAAVTTKTGQPIPAQMGMDPYAYGASQMAYDPSMYYGASDYGAATGGGGYGGGGSAPMIGPDGVPEATVEVTDTMPQEGPGMGTLALVAGAGLLLLIAAKKGKK